MGKAGTKSWQAVTNRDRLKAIRGTAKLIPAQKLEEGPPTKCQLRISERCAPDFDGDGRPDVLYRMDWFVPTNPEDPDVQRRRPDSPVIQIPS